MLDTFIGALSMVAGTATLSYTLLQIWRAYRSLNWPVIPGEVVRTKIKEHRGRWRGYEPVVRYRYEWEGRAYQGNRLVFSATSVIGSLDEAEQSLKQMPVGSRIPVRVCPVKSQLSVVKPGFERAWWIPLAFSVLLIISGFSLWNRP